nr:putative ribonuclease H-like domain-containing protein [Tanacetum cinerariifolium]
MYAVCVCARFQVTPKVSHLHAVKRIFRYLKGHPKFGLWYPRDFPFELVAYTDSDYAEASLDRKSTTGGCQFLGRRLISWQCKKQTVVDTSTTEAKYMAAASCYGQGPILQGKGSIIPVESYHTPLDEAASTGVDVRHGGAATTVTSLDVGQGSGNINKTPFMPHDSPLPRVNTLGSDEGSMTLQELTVLCTTLTQKVKSLEADLKQTKQVYGAAYTRLIMKVKKLEKNVKTSKARRQAKIVVFDDEKEFKDPSKQERSMIEEIDQDAKVTLVTPTQVSTQREAHSQPKDQLGVLSAAKILADVAKVHTYTKRRWAVNTISDGISTASRIVSTAKESVSTTGASMPVSTAGMIDKGKGIMEESESVQIKTKRQQERLGLETAVRLQEQFNEEERQRIARVHEAAQTFTKEE